MERLIYFINKALTFLTSIHPLVYLTIFILAGLLFLAAKWIIQIYFPASKRQNLTAWIVAIFIGLPAIAVVLYLMVGLLLKDQPF